MSETKDKIDVKALKNVPMNEAFIIAQGLEGVDYVEFLKTFRNVRNFPYICDPNDIGGSLKPMIIGQLSGFPATINKKVAEDIKSETLRPGYLKEMIDGQTANFRIVAKNHLGTHTVKAPNPTATTPNGIFASPTVFEEARALPFASSASSKTRLTFGAAGNAGQGRAQRFLGTKLMIGDDAKNVSVCIIEKDAVFTSLLGLGFDPDLLNELSDTLRKRLSGDEDRTLGKGAKVLIWPTQNSETYITPVHPYAMHLEVGTRIKERRASGSAIKTRFIKVAGSNPLNAGLVNSDLSGTHILLDGTPPKISDRAERRFTALAHSKSLRFGKVNASHPSVKTFNEGSKSWKNNDGIRKMLEKNLRIMTSIVVEPLATIEEGIVANNAHAKNAVEALEAPLARLVLNGFGNLEDTDRKKVVAKLVGALDAIPGKPEFDDPMTQRAERVVASYLTKKFTGVS
ncbi:hypothetical protein [Roseibium sp. RKSG952]|uniref:hypothetical protein n=1 Tax=Roseibium sp. RKSG952 TaxID=2529384 RepID=UPI0012BB634F|nr:hypothetical protein [Roseibium sp. RKSG952]MTH95505.1 hypothetical protein [Roseibium sp. RKSG952]